MLTKKKKKEMDWKVSFKGKELNVSKSKIKYIG